VVGERTVNVRPEEQPRELALSRTEFIPFYALSGRWDDAERRGRHSHAERGNEGILKSRPGNLTRVLRDRFQDAIHLVLQRLEPLRHLGQARGFGCDLGQSLALAGDPMLQTSEFQSLFVVAIADLVNPIVNARSEILERVLLLRITRWKRLRANTV
jgi:hypothetical protein